jgi:hypothetical protein
VVEGDIQEPQRKRGKRSITELANQFSKLATNENANELSSGKDDNTLLNGTNSASSNTSTTIYYPNQNKGKKLFRLAFTIDDRDKVKEFQQHCHKVVLQFPKCSNPPFCRFAQNRKELKRNPLLMI